jgi:hypothetical protein
MKLTLRRARESCMRRAATVSKARTRPRSTTLASGPTDDILADLFRRLDEAGFYELVPVADRNELRIFPQLERTN